MAKPESFTFTVGKLDAGMAILLGERAHLIEFPSLLLPPGATTGSIVNIAVHRNHAEEKRRENEFWDLQKEILDSFGVDTPRAPKLELRNVTQTSVTLEWPALHMATAKLRSLDIYRNGQRLAAIPQPLGNTSTKLSGLELDTDYTFQLVLRTSAGTYPSNVVLVRTHTMSDTSGVSVCFGTVQDKVMLENAKLALREMRARWSDKIQIDTTHFVCTTPAATPNGAQASGSMSMGPGVEYQRALQLSIPVVQPQWILACHNEKKMVAIGKYYLGADASAPMSSAPFTRPQSMSQVSLVRSPTRANSGNTPANRASMPPQARPTNTNQDAANFVNPASPVQSPTPRARSPETVGHGNFAAMREESEDEEEEPGQAELRKSHAGRQRNGTMNKNFRFPSPSPSSSPTSPPPPGPPPPVPRTAQSPPTGVESENKRASVPVSASATASVEVPPPPPVEKERVDHSEGDEDVGETEEIPL